MIRVVGRMTVTLNEQENQIFLELTKKLFLQTQQHDKPTLYTCNRDIYNPSSYVWDEIWRSKADLDSHLQSQHFQDWWSWVEPHLAAPLQVSYCELDDMQTL